VLAQLVQALPYKLEYGGFDSRWGYWIFFIDIILTAALRGRIILWEKGVPGGGVSGGKGCRYIGLAILSPSCADCLKSWEVHPPGSPRG
jgi:hypothetical protein